MAEGICRNVKMSAPWWSKEPTSTKMGCAEYTTITTLMSSTIIVIYPNCTEVKVKLSQQNQAHKQGNANCQNRITDRNETAIHGHLKILFILKFVLSCSYKHESSRMKSIFRSSCKVQFYTQLSKNRMGEGIPTFKNSGLLLHFNSAMTRKGVSFY